MSGLNPNKPVPSFDIGFAPAVPVTPVQSQAMMDSSAATLAPIVSQIKNAVAAPVVQAAKLYDATMGTMVKQATTALNRCAKTLSNVYSAIDGQAVSAIALQYMAGMPYGIPVPGQSAGGAPPVQLVALTTPPRPPLTPAADQPNNIITSVPGDIDTGRVKVPCLGLDGHWYPAGDPHCNSIYSTGGGGGHNPNLAYWCYSTGTGVSACGLFDPTDPSTFPPDFQGLISGPYVNAADCQAACNPKPPPPPPPPSRKWYCITDSSGVVSCRFFDPITDGIPIGFAIVSGPYDTIQACLPKCGGQIITGGCPPGCIPITDACKICSQVCGDKCPPGGGGGGGPPGGGGGGGGGPPNKPCDPATDPTCETTSSGEPCPKPEGADDFWWLDTCSDDYKDAVNKELTLDPTSIEGNGGIGQVVRNLIDPLAGVEMVSAEDSLFLE